MPYTVVAHNYATESDNKIHADDVARKHGFEGGLVPGVAVYAYLTRPCVQRWGLDWVERGTMSARFTKPVYEGEAVACSLSPESVLEATGPDGDERARGDAALPDVGAVTAPSVADYPVADVPARDDRPAATREVFGGLGVLGSLHATFHVARAPEYLADIRDDHPLYREVCHPGWLMQYCNWILSANVVLGPWVHVSSDARHFRAVGDGDAVSIRGRVSDLFERKGHDFVELDLLLVANDTEPVMHVRHTAIYRLRGD